MFEKQSLGGFLFGFVLASTAGTNAQNITPSNVNGLNTSVDQIGDQYNITGGTQAGTNLFHSLQKLGLSTGEIANFLSNSSVQNILTRVTGGEASLINGLLQVTGGNSNLFIMNPAGIVFGSNASLNVPANFSATTATGIQVGNAWFGMNSSADQVANLTGDITGYAFTNTLPSFDPNPAGVISNAGNLAVNTGNSVTLVGGMVVNTGAIATPEGTITIAATEDNKFIQISNEGALISIELPIADQQALGNAPVLRGVDLPNLLRGKTAGTAIASGNLDVSGNIGGNVQVLGNEVSLVGANINASGVNGGGTVLIGGDFQGTGTTPKSQLTTVDASSTIHADAVTNGDGGTVVVWSDGNTNFDGTITAKGGTQSGDGGLVETSGKNNLVVGNTAQVNTTAPQGERGTWLLDPTDLTVVTSGGTDATVAAANANAGASTINNSTIVSALNGTDVNLTATNAITVNAAIDSSANVGAGNLALTAPTTNLNAPITLKAGSTLSGTATTVNVGTGGTVQNGVDAAAAGGTVNLAATTYLNGEIVIGKSLTLNGAGAQNTILSGNNTSRVLRLGSTGGANGANTYNINNLTIANGNGVSTSFASGFAGGLLLYDASDANDQLNINNSVIRDNSAVTNGGAIYVDSALVNITNSTINANNGGLTNVMTMFDLTAGSSLTNVTISGNTAGVGYGALSNEAHASQTTDLTLTNVTIANNIGGGLVYGPQTGVTTQYRNTIFANNTAGNVVALYGEAGAVTTSLGNNISSDGTGNLIAAGDLPNTDPLLGALANNGGSTPIHALLSGSPAIEAGNSTFAPTTDQRGLTRFGKTDIGAYEYQFKVTNTNDSGLGSFRSALTNTNASTNTETVIFRIPTSDAGYTGSYWSIAPTSALPNITKPVIIDGYSQAGASPNTLLIGDNAKLAIELTGTNAGSVNGLNFASGSGGSTVKGLAINNFGQLGIYLQSGSNGTTVAGNFIGTDITGTTAKSNAWEGIRIDSGSNFIGGTALADRNIISANKGSRGQIWIVNSSGSNEILNNYIGTDASGLLGFGFGTSVSRGITIENSPNNVIGGAIATTTDLSRNVISGNGGDGIGILGATSTGTTIQGNYIGITADGNTALGNQLQGIYLQSSNNIIGGTTAAVRNILSANQRGVYLDGANATGNKVQGNYIGTDVTGNLDLGNSNSGVFLYNGASNNLIGGTTSGAGNLISGNDNHGIDLFITNTVNNQILGNLIGTKADGLSALGNTNSGIFINGSSNNIVGDGTVLGRNIISGSLNNYGIFIGNASGGVPTGNKIQGNYIGTDIIGTVGLGNKAQNIIIYSPSNTITGNVIADSKNSDGIALVGSAATGNTIQGNFIGTNAAGTVALGNKLQGIYVESANNTIGGTTAAERNIISGNSDRGVYLNGTNATNNTIQNNYIGTDITGTNDLGNTSSGVLINNGSFNNRILNNVISGNDRQGNTVQFSNSNVLVTNGSHDNTIAGNFIGTNATGTGLLTGTTNGGARGIQILLGSYNNTVGGITSADRNIISGNRHFGVELDYAGTNSNRILGNYIGTDVTGNNALGNGNGGIQLYGQSPSNNVIGTVGAGNVISGNGQVVTGDGYGIILTNNGGNNNVIQSNFIGTNAAGTAALKNTNRGIYIQSGTNTVIGGTNTGEGNIISSNGQSGVYLDTGSSTTKIQGNYIGTDVTGNNALGNTGRNIDIRSANNTIIKNVIADSKTSDGIALVGSAATGNTIQGNFIGTNATGSSALGNKLQGIYVESANNTIGGTTAAVRNIISGNSDRGIYLVSSATNTTIQGNYIGTDITGTVALGNANRNVDIRSANNTIGGAIAGAGNVIADSKNSDGIALAGAAATGNTIQGNFIGTNLDGTAALGNKLQGIYVESANNLIGGSTTAARNIISGNGDRGIYLNGTNAKNNKVQGNDIGTNAAGTGAIANASDGILLNSGANNNFIGTDSDGVNDAAEGNLLSGNGKVGFFGNGVYITGTNTSSNVVAGNKIGTDVTGTSAISNQNNGLAIAFGATNNRIGGTLATERNLISGNNAFTDTWGIWIGNANNNTVQGNYFGTDITGTSALPNGAGIVVMDSSGTKIGGSTTGAGNLISGHNGISFVGSLGNGITLYGGATQNTLVQGNLIGTNATGTAAIPNTLGGIAIQNAAKNNTIDQNVISGNTQNGVIITGTGTNANSVTNNKIGTQIDGTSALANSQNGVLIEAGASNNIIGGTAANTGNAIAFNAKGVGVTGNTSIGNQILSNSIFSNVGLGIDLNNDGITPNGANPRAFPNNGQNYPLLITASGTTISGVLNSVPNTTYRLEFFASDTAEQGKMFLGTTNVTTDDAGIATFNSTVTAIPAGQLINATATNSVSGTSEFSATPGITLTATAGAPQSTTVNQSFATPLQATVTDTRGNLAGNGIPVNFATTTAVSGATGTFPGGTTVTTNNSIATAPIKANTITGTYNASASATGSSNSVSFLNLTNTPDAPASITATGGTPQSTVVNAAFANQLQVLVKDQFGNVVPNSTVTFTSPSSGASTSATTTTATTDANGVAKVSVTANTITGSYTNTATSGKAIAANFNLINTPDIPANLTVTGGNNQSTVVNTAFAEQLQVRVQDQFGNVVPNSTVTFTAPNSGASTSVTTTTATADANGIAKVSLTANTITGSYTNTATSGKAIAANFNLTNTPDIPANLTVTGGNNQSTVVNTAFAEQLQVRVQDQFGNIVPNSTVTFTAPSNGASTAITTTTATADANGIAKVSLIANTITGSYTNTATSGKAIAANFNLTNTPDVPANLTVTGGNNQSTVVNTAFAEQLQVRVQDQFGNIVPNSTVTFTAPSNGASTAITTTTTTADANGIATISIAANTIAGNYIKTATSGTATTANFNLTNTPDIPASITATGGTPQATIVTTTFGKLLQVTVRDQFGNLVPNSTVTFTTPNSGASGNFADNSTTITAITDLNGIAQVPITANNLLGNFESIANVEGVAIAANFNLTNLLSIDDPELLRQHKNQIIKLFFEQVSAGDFNKDTVAFLLSHEIDVVQLSRLLLQIVKFMNEEGGEFSISPQKLWQDSDISLINEAVNQEIIQVAIHSSVNKFIGSEYVEFVDVKVESKDDGEDEKNIRLKIRKAPQFVQFKN